MNKQNLATFCVFTVLLVFSVIQPALAVSPKVNQTLPASNQTLHKPVPKTVPTKVVPPKGSCPCIAFRLDDVQGSYLSDVQMKVMDVFQKKNASLSIGVIGLNLTLDKKLVPYLKNNLKPGHAPVDVTNLGWKHENFASLGLSQQIVSMNRTNQELVKTFGEKPSVFAAPFDAYNNDTLKAIKQLKMNTISSGIWAEDKFITTKGKIVANKDSLGLYHVPYMTNFQIDNGNESYWTGITKDKVIVNMDSHISKYGYDVLLLHPQNFAVFSNGKYVNTVNKTYLDEIASIIDYAKSKHMQIVTLSDIAGLDHTNTKTVTTTSKVVPVSKSVTASTSPTTTPVSKSTTVYTPKPVTAPVSIPLPEVNISKFLEATQPSKVVAFVEQNGSLTMNLKYLAGDRVSASTISLKIYRDFDRTPYMQFQHLTGNPFTVMSLPMFHQYKIETYVGGMLSSTNLVVLDKPQQDLDVNIPNGGSILVSVYYSDGQTPITNASVSIRSQDNKTRDVGLTDPDGLVSKFYLPSTTTYGNYYVVDVKINNHLKFSSTPITLQPDDGNEIKLIAPWPSVIQNLVTVKVYNQTKLLSSYGKPYAVDMFDDKGNKLAESPINIHGEGYFWSVKTGDYVFKVVNTTSDRVLGNLIATLDGTKNNFDVVLKENSFAKAILD
jgi:peptidoglycan/xylan/chitin deacetylase (PgdA/CDA1 family)